ncbi:aminoglycoside phosphotransferase [Serinibacter salmoneus]|uniref:Aminoglycoside phosphotransferase n=1 Tax=Serinibacter salmoneus TaxID=556530 RepID=A0A2A9D487_9MICO|nr:aminoglycoside phosphotransferase [Serinibacter salmoneus]PFG21201.1 hypothetical protein ATL40_2824 [Serinibacter salmoneus]
MPGAPDELVLDRFAVTHVERTLPGGRGRSVLAGDLVLSPDREPGTQRWLSPIQARLASELDNEAGRRPLRLALPVPARDGEWVVQGWGATRFEPRARPCHDLALMRAAGHLLHARLAVAVPARPEALSAAPRNRWDRAEALAFGDPAALPEPAGWLRGHVAHAATVPGGLGPDQLVHRDLAGNVLLDGAGSALVIDLSPAWRPVLWAEAICVLDAVLWHGADRDVLADWRGGRERLAMLRAVAFRVLSDEPVAIEAYRAVVAELGAA